MNLSDDTLLKFWRQVQGPHAELNGPLIRYAGLVLAEAERRAFEAGRFASKNRNGWTFDVESCARYHGVYTSTLKAETAEALSAYQQQARQG